MLLLAAQQGSWELGGGLLTLDGDALDLGLGLGVVLERLGRMFGRKMELHLASLVLH